MLDRSRDINLYVLCCFVICLWKIYNARDESESDDELWIAIVVCITGGMLIINVLTIIIVSLYCKHRYSIKNVHELVNSLTKVKEKAKTNPTYGPLPKKDETRKEVYNAVYTSSGSVTLGGATDEPLGDVQTTDDDDYVVVKNVPGNPVDANVSNVNTADVTVKPNPSYNIHADRSEIDDAVYIAPYEATTQGSAEPAAVYDYTSFDAKTTGNTNTVTGDSKMEDYPTYGNIDTIKMLTNKPPYVATK